MPQEDDEFQICISGPSHPTGNCKTIGAAGGKLTWTNLIPGSYDVVETSQGEWSTEVIGSPVSVPTNGGTVAAEVNNTRKLGSLQITKTIDWSGIEPLAGQTFEICIEGPSYPVAAACSPYTYQASLVQTKSGLLPGDYEVTEGDPGVEWIVQLPPAPVTVPTDGSTAADQRRQHSQAGQPRGHQGRELEWRHARGGQLRDLHLRPVLRDAQLPSANH